MPDFLETMARSSVTRVKEARSRETLAALSRRAAGIAAPPSLDLHDSRFDLIAEIKLRAPSDRSVTAATPPVPHAIATRAGWYAEAGAAAVSVLTEPTRFSGHLDHLAEASRACRVPTIRKDFLVDPYQIVETRACGAGGALVILRMVDDARIREMLDAAGQMGLFVLLEAFDMVDLARASTLIEQSGAEPRHPRVLVGMNCRDLATLTVEPSRLEIPSGEFPATAVRVAESGIETPTDAARIARLGYDMALVGGALMRHADPRVMLRDMIDAGRTARRAAGRTQCV